MSTAAEKKSEANKRAYEKRKAKLASASASVSIADVPKPPSPKYTKSVAKKTLASLEMPSPAPTPSKTPMTDAEKKAKRAEYNKRAYEKKKAGLTATKSATDAPTPAKKSVAKKTPAKKSVAKPSPAPAPSPAPTPSAFELMAPPKIITPATLGSLRARLKPKPAPFIFHGQKQTLLVRDGVKYWVQTSEDDDDEDEEPREVYDYYDKTFIAYYHPWSDELQFLDDSDTQEWRWEAWNAQNEEIAKMDAMLALTPAEYAKYLKANKKKAAPPPEKKPPRPLFAFELRALPPAEYAKYMKAQKGKEAYERKKADKPPAERGPGRPEKRMFVGRSSPDFEPEPPPKILTPVDDDDDEDEAEAIPVRRFVYDKRKYLKSDGDVTNDQNVWGILYRESNHEPVGYYNEYLKLPMRFKYMNPEVDLDYIDTISYTFKHEITKELLIALRPSMPNEHDVFDPEIARKVGVATFDNDYDASLDRLGYKDDDDDVDVPYIEFDTIWVTKIINGKKYRLNASDEDVYYGMPSRVYDYDTKEDVGEYDNDTGEAIFDDKEDDLDLDTDSDDDVMLGALTKKVAGITLDPMKPPSFS